MNMKALEDLRETLDKELDAISKKKEINPQLLENIDKLTRSIKNIDKIIMAEEGEMEHSRMGGWEARGMYGDGNSYANRGQHYVRGHYSRDGYSRDGWDMRGGYDDGYDTRGRMRGHSRDGEKHITEQLYEMMDGANEKEREAIKRCLNELDK